MSIASSSMIIEVRSAVRYFPPSREELRAYYKKFPEAAISEAYLSGKIDKERARRLFEAVRLRRRLRSSQERLRHGRRQT